MHDIVKFPPPDKSDTQLKTCVCGRVFTLRKPCQEFCSHRCRQAALRTRQTRVTHGMTDPSGAAEINDVRPSPIQEVPRNTHASRPENRGVRSPRHVIEAEVSGGRVWRQVASPDGVVCEVGTLRKRTLVDGGAS